jgi:hypothetical protein
MEKKKSILNNLHTKSNSEKKLKEGGQDILHTISKNPQKTIIPKYL